MATSWTEFSADLSAYIGLTIQLQLSMRRDFVITRPGVYIDDFLVAD